MYVQQEVNKNKIFINVVIISYFHVDIFSQIKNYYKLSLKMAKDSRNM